MALAVALAGSCQVAPALSSELLPFEMLHFASLWLAAISSSLSVPSRRQLESHPELFRLSAENRLLREHMAWCLVFFLQFNLQNTQSHIFHASHFYTRQDKSFSSWLFQYFPTDTLSPWTPTTEGFYLGRGPRITFVTSK